VLSNPLEQLTTGKQTVNSVLIHSGKSDSTRRKQTLQALTPVVLAAAWLFGPLVLLNIILCSLFGAAMEALARLLRRMPGRDFYRDEDTLIIATLAGLCLATSTSWWQILIVMAVAILLCKHAFGGLGQSPFHPLMPALLFLTIAFPDSQMEEIPAQWALFNLAALLGAIFLLLKKAIRPLLPLSILFTIIAWTFLSDFNAPPGTAIAQALFQQPALLLLVFYVATNPGNTPSHGLGKLAYGVLLGSLLSINNSLPSFAACIVLTNFLAPLLNQLLDRDIYGHENSQCLPLHENHSRKLNTDLNMSPNTGEEPAP